MVGLRLNKAKSGLEPVRDIKFLGLRLHLDRGRASLPLSKAQEIMARACRISSQKTLLYIEVSQLMGALNRASGLILFVSSTLEAPTTTFSFFRSDETVCTTVEFRPCSPCYPTQTVAGPIVSHIRNPYPAFPGRVHHFHRRLDPGLGRPQGGFSNCGCMDPFRTRDLHQCTVTQGGNIGPPSLGYNITGPSCFDCYRQHHCCSSHQQTKWDPFPPPVAAGSGSVSMATDSGHNSTSQTHSGLPKYDSRPIVLAEPAHHDRVESPPQSLESDIQTVENSSSGHVCHSSQHASSPVYVSSSGASSSGDRCLVTGLTGEVNVHVSTISPAKQSHSEAQDHPDRRGDTHRPLVAVTAVVPTPATTECGPPMILSVPQRPRLLSQQGYISSRTICMHGGSHAALPSSRIFKGGL